MWDAIGSAIKVFAEKHLVPTVIALVVAAGALVFLPIDYWMITKVGNPMFFWFTTGAAFLVVQAIIALYKKIMSLMQAQKERKNEKLNEEIRERNETERLISFVERLPAKDRELIIDFIKSGNKPIIEHAFFEYIERPLYKSNVIVHMTREDHSSYVKLEEDFFNDIKTIYERTGSITHFTPEELQ